MPQPRRRSSMPAACLRAGLARKLSKKLANCGGLPTSYRLQNSLPAVDVLNKQAASERCRDNVSAPS